MARWTRLLSLVVRTRLSRPMLIFIAIMIAYGVAVGAATYAAHASLPPGLRRSEMTLAVAYAAVITFLMSFQGGTAVLKSDRDYLFTLPLSGRSLAAALFVGQLLITGALFVAWLGWVLPLTGIGPAYAVADGALYVVFLTLLSSSVAELETKRRAAVAGALALWSATPLLGNPLAPSAPFRGYLAAGTATLAAATAALAAATFRRLARAPVLYGYEAATAAGEGLPVYRSGVSFAGSTPRSAIYRMRLSAVTVSGRVGGVGGSRYVTGRVRLRTLAEAVAGAAAAYWAVGYALARLGYVAAVPPHVMVTPATAGSLTAAYAMLVVPAIMVEALTIGMSTFSLGNERPWLAFTSVRPGYYLRHSALSWALVSLVIAAPFSAAVAGLEAVYWRAPLVAAALASLTPLLTLLSYFLGALLVTTPQIRYEGVTPGQVRARGLVISLVIIAGIGVTASSFAAPPGYLGAAVAALALVDAPLAVLDAPWDAAARRLVEAGYT